MSWRVYLAVVLGSLAIGLGLDAVGARAALGLYGAKALQAGLTVPLVVAVLVAARRPR